MKMKRLNLILSALLVIIMIACSCATVFAAGDVSSAIESTWNDAKSQIHSGNPVLCQDWFSVF